MIPLRFPAGVSPGNLYSQPKSVLPEGIKKGQASKISKQPMTSKVMCSKAKNRLIWALKKFPITLSALRKVFHVFVSNSCFQYKWRKIIFI